MAEYYEIASSLPDSIIFDLNEWASRFDSPMLAIVAVGSVWRMENDKGMELGAAFQFENRIYVEWQYLSFGPMYCWFATQLVGILIQLRATVSVRPCTMEEFAIALKANSRITT